MNPICRPASPGLEHPGAILPQAPKAPKGPWGLGRPGASGARVSLLPLAAFPQLAVKMHQAAAARPDPL